METIKFSVVMSVYNKDDPKFFYESVESLLTQELLPNEIIIIQDGKLTNELYDVINKLLQNKIIKTYILEQNCGVAKAINFGVTKAKYEYIARLDADDIATKNRFKKQFEYIKMHPEIDFIGGQIYEYNDNLTKKISTRKVPIEHEDIIKRCKVKSPVNNTTIIFKKKIFETLNGYNEAYRVMEDYDLYIRAIKNGYKFHNIPEIIVNVRVNNNTYKRRGGVKYVKVILKIQKQLLQEKMISKPRYIFNVIIRGIISMMPNNLRRIVYKKFLRDK